MTEGISTDADRYPLSVKTEQRFNKNQMAFAQSELDLG